MESWVTHDSSTLEPDPREEFWVARDSLRAGAPDSVGTKELTHVVEAQRKSDEMGSWYWDGPVVLYLYSWECYKCQYSKIKVGNKGDYIHKLWG